MSAPQLMVKATGVRGEVYRLWEESKPKMKLVMHYRNTCGLGVYYLMDDLGNVLRSGNFKCTWWTEQHAREAVRLVLDEFFPEHELAWQ